MQFAALTKKEVKKPQGVVVVSNIEPGVPLPDYKRFLAKKILGMDGKFIYIVETFPEEREVLRMVGHKEVDDTARSYIRRCYGRKETIIQF